MKRLGKIQGVEVRMLKNPMLSLLSVSSEPEFIVSVFGECYLVRTYNGGGGTNVVHFASEKFTVKFPSIKSIVFMPRSPRARRAITVKGFSFGGSVKVIEPLIKPECLGERKYTEIIVFNPAPSDVSYVSPEKTKIKIAFTGDEVYGRKIFTISTFEIFVDREARRIRNEENNPKSDIRSNLFAAK